MSKLTGFLAAMAVSAVFAPMASASTLICEGGGPGPANKSDCDYVRWDFSNDGADPNPLLTITEATEIRGGITSPFLDTWQMDFGTDFYEITFSSNSVGNTLFEASLEAGGTTINVDGSGATFEFPLIFTGLNTFTLTGTAGSGQWQVNAAPTSLQIVPAVPLPASGMLLLAAFGAAGFAARRKSA
ncbi:MAG: VPLPA-CTERM sorting domain-containing protein [Pseudomonadota bacterium]